MSSASQLPDLSTLAAKPPQRPSEQSLPSRSSEPNDTSALLEPSRAANPRHQSRPLQRVSAPDSKEQEEDTSPTSASWRPNLDRQQSWNMQDHKRAMQSPLMSPKLDRKGHDYGFSSKDDKDVAEDAKS